jgi:hypothetical protein
MKAAKPAETMPKMKDAAKQAPAAQAIHRPAVGSPTPTASSAHRQRTAGDYVAPRKGPTALPSRLSSAGAGQAGAVKMKAAKPAETMPKMKDAGKLIGQRTTPTNKTTSSQVVNLKAAKPSSTQTAGSSAAKSSTPANKGFAPTRGLVSARGGFSLGGYVPDKPPQ